MKIIPFWVKETRAIKSPSGEKMHLHGLSDVSMADAREKLERRAELRRRFSRGDMGDMGVEALRRALRELDGDAYLASCICEPVVNELDAANIITRNRYGAQVLNSTDLCFVDVDSVKDSFANALLSLFGAGKSAEARLLEQLRALCAARPGMGARLYRTAAGFRVVLAGAPLEPGSAGMKALFRELNADALYAALCERQQCWRARLTPKPYRIGQPKLPPCADSESMQAALTAWVPEYEAKSASFCVCKLVESVGRSIHHPALELHDEMTGARLAERRLA